MRTKLALAAVTLLMLTACGQSETSTESNIEPAMSSAANYTVIVDWRRIPADNNMATDIYVRILKIENVCYLQTASQHDWQYSVVPTGHTC